MVPTLPLSIGIGEDDDEDDDTKVHHKHVKNNAYFCRQLCNNSVDGNVHKDDKEANFNQLIS